jgi:hypothetical protein
MRRSLLVISAERFAAIGVTKAFCVCNMVALEAVRSSCEAVMHHQKLLFADGFNDLAFLCIHTAEPCGATIEVQRLLSRNMMMNKLIELIDDVFDY